MIRELDYVYAAHDIRRGDHLVVKCGSPGRVLSARPSWFESTYTVNFTGVGKNQRGAITLIGLNTDDVHRREVDIAGKTGVQAVSLAGGHKAGPWHAVQVT